MKPEATKAFSLDGKVVILTGGAGFLGQQYAKALALAGAKVVLWDQKDGEDFTQLAGVDYHYRKTDITYERDVEAAVVDVVMRHGRIDCLVNNAAMNPAVGSEESKNQFVPIEDYPVELWRRELDVNLTGMFICTKVVVPIMKKQGKGVIVNVASEVSNIAHDHRVYNQQGKYKSPAYVASKTGVVGLTRACAAQLGEFGIRVNTFSPGGVRHEKIPKDFVERFGQSNMLGRMAEADEYCATLIYLCSDASSFMTGANLTADGGKSVW